MGGRKHMKKVSAKTIRRHLHKHGLKPKSKMVLKGGEDPVPDVPETPPAGGKRGKKGTAKKGTAKKHRLRHASVSLGHMFGL